MKRTLHVVILIVACVAWLTSVAFAQESATPEEVIEKCKQAATFLASEGEAGLVQFNDPKGPWAWKDTYVFVYDCEPMILVAHPKESLIGQEPDKIKDAKGSFISIDLCSAVQDSDSGWAEYFWPKPGQDTPARKVSYMLKVPGQPYTVGAGIYSDTVSAEELNKTAK